MDEKFYFEEPRLSMTLPGRIFVRTASYISYAVFFVAGFSMILSNVVQLRAFGILILLFFADLFLHLGEGDKPFSEANPKAEKINLAEHLSPSAYSIIERSFDKSIISKSNFFSNVVRELLQRKDVAEGVRRLDLDPRELAQKNDSLTRDEGTKKSYGKNETLPMVEALILNAGKIGVANKREFIEPSDIFSALFFVGDEILNRFFNTFSIEADDLQLALLLSSLKKKWDFRLPSTLGGFSFEAQRGMRHRVVNRAWTSRPTPTLDKFSSDLTDLAAENEVGFIIGHNGEYQRMVDAISKPLSPNVLLVGEEGVGKETMVMHLARQIVKDEVPGRLFDKRLVSLEISSLVAGASPEELQARLKKIVEEITISENVILYIPDFHNLVRTSGEYYLSAADALMPIIKNDLFPLVGATYPREYKEFVESRSDIKNIFEVIMVNEVNEKEARKILVYDSLILERKTGIVVSFAAIKAAVTLGKKYLAGKFLPSSAQELLRSALSAAAREKNKYLTRDDIVKTAEAKVNVPIHEASGVEAEALLHLEEMIHKRLIDQEEAVKAVSSALREYRSGLSRPGGTIANFLFVGPTGVGKTELAKILAKIQFGSESATVRFDMTEYQDKESFIRFIGSPDGRTSGALTDAVLHKPYSLILLDEFEKAFPDILNLFLQVFDDGRLTDNLGRTVSFENTIIIATSNAHSDIINESLSKGEKMADIADYLKRKLADVFKPELLNRFSKIVVFKDLSPEDVYAVAKINLADLAGMLLEQGVKLEFDESAIKQISKLGYEPAFGARPLRRAIEENLRAPLAEKILKKEINRGDNVEVYFKDNSFKFESKR